MISVVHLQTHRCRQQTVRVTLCPAALVTVHVLLVASRKQETRGIDGRYLAHR
jgi:hypothetical protein